MNKDSDTFITNNERAFVIKALREGAGTRLDGRTPYEYRKARLQFALDDTSATLTLGQTRVMAVIQAELDAPFPDRPNEGAIRFNVEAGPMASPAFEPGRPGVDAVELARLIERGLKQSGALDTEALCVLPGRKVWSLRCDMHILDHDGNLADACHLAALAAFMAFRRPDTTPDGTSIIVHPPEEKEPLPLTIHHHPVCVTFALFEDGDMVAIDPTRVETAASVGSATLVVNSNAEVCAVHKADGIGLTQSQVMRLARIACTRATELLALVRKGLQEHEVARVAARVRRAETTVGVPKPSRFTTVSTQLQQAAGTAGGSPAPAAGEQPGSSIAGQQQQQGASASPQQPQRQQVPAPKQTLKQRRQAEKEQADKLAAEIGIDLKGIPDTSSEEDLEGDAGKEDVQGEEQQQQQRNGHGKGPKQQQQQQQRAGSSPAKAPAGKGGAAAGAAGRQAAADDLVLPSKLISVGGKPAAGKNALDKKRSPLQSPRATLPRAGSGAGTVSPPATAAVPGPVRPQAEDGQQAGSGKKRRAAAGSPGGLTTDDGLEAIAAVIAGAGRDGGDEEGKEPDLRDAVKQDKVKKAKKAAAAKKG